MKPYASMFILSTLITGSAWADGLPGIVNDGTWVQTTRTQTYTVGEDGSSLLYRNKPTGMHTTEPTTPGSKLSYTDPNIAARPRTSSTPAANSAGGATPTPAPSPTPTPASGSTGTTSGATPTAASGGTASTPASGGTTGTSGTASTSASGGAGGTSGTSGTTQKKTLKSKWQGKSTMGKFGAVGGVAVGALGIYEATSGQGEHTWGNVIGGAVSGAFGGAQVGGAWGAAIGAVVGGVIAGSQKFSETDCDYDAVTGKFTCCNTLFNKGERLANIGDYMFCKVEASGKVPAQYGVRQCLQGGKATESSWWDGLWEDDAWSPECKFRFCGDAPVKGLNTTNLITYTPDTNKFCWNWDCATGYVKKGNTCEEIAQPVKTPSQPQPIASPSQPQTPSVDTQLYQGAIAQLEANRARIQEICGPNPNGTTAATTQSAGTTQQSTGTTQQSTNKK